ncbi:XapX domain-containing protein [Rouxiella badensis]|uniref:XapX domain-containing protein n=1 Tax=Rouxiella badensis TaxID=1646377 RepID=UPI003C426970
MQIFYALIAGLSVGLFFSWLKLPLPAPPTLVGIVGAAGVFLGSVIFRSVAAWLH